MTTHCCRYRCTICATPVPCATLANAHFLHHDNVNERAILQYDELVDMAGGKGTPATLLTPCDLQLRVIVKGKVRNRSARSLTKSSSNSCLKVAGRLRRTLTVGGPSRDSRDSSGCDGGRDSRGVSRTSRKSSWQVGHSDCKLSCRQSTWQPESSAVPADADAAPADDDPSRISTCYGDDVDSVIDSFRSSRSESNADLSVPLAHDVVKRETFRTCAAHCRPLRDCCRYAS